MSRPAQGAPSTSVMKGLSAKPFPNSQSMKRRSEGSFHGLMQTPRDFATKASRKLELFRASRSAPPKLVNGESTNARNGMNPVSRKGGIPVSGENLGLPAFKASARSCLHQPRTAPGPDPPPPHAFHTTRPGVSSGRHAFHRKKRRKCRTRTACSSCQAQRRCRQTVS